VIKKVVINPQHPMFFLDGGTKFADIPLAELGTLVSMTSSAWTIICAPNVDGATEVTIAPMISINPGRPAVHEGILETPLNKIVLSLATGEKPLEVEVPTRETRLSVWANHPRLPTAVLIGFS
jgi:hypothetical protein